VTDGDIELSIVIPLYNEEASVPRLFKSLNKLSKSLPSRTEVVLVNDGSTDRTESALLKTKLNFTQRVITLSRNFGQQPAILAGLEAARGKIVVNLDADLQHPPELILQMLKYHRKGVDIVFTTRKYMSHPPLIKRFFRFFFYSFINFFSDKAISIDISDFMSFKRKALSTVLELKERRRFLRGLAQWIGFSTVVIEYQVNKRETGESKYTLFKLLQLSFDSITSFTVAPLYAAGIFGLILFVCATIYAGYVLYIRIVVGSISGWASMLFVLLVLVAFLSIFLGLLGIYMAAIYDELKRRPIYIVKTQTSRKKLSIKTERKIRAENN